MTADTKPFATREEFEVIDRVGASHRYKYAEGFFWEFRIKPGTVDEEDLSCVEVNQENVDGYDLVATFLEVAAVGDVTGSTALNFPLHYVTTLHADALNRLAQAEEVIRECEELLREVGITVMGGHWLAARRHLWDQIAAYRERKHD